MDTCSVIKAAYSSKWVINLNTNNRWWLSLVLLFRQHLLWTFWFWTRDPSNVARELCHYATQHFVIMCVRFLILVIYYWHVCRLIILELKWQRGSGASRANSESELFYFIVAHGAHWHPIPNPLPIILALFVHFLRTEFQFQEHFVFRRLLCCKKSRGQEDTVVELWLGLIWLCRVC